MVPNAVALALMLSTMSNSPTLGHVPPLRIGAPSIQNAGQ